MTTSNIQNHLNNRCVGQVEKPDSFTPLSPVNTGIDGKKSVRIQMNELLSLQNNNPDGYFYSRDKSLKVYKV